MTLVDEITTGQVAPGIYRIRSKAQPETLATEFAAEGWRCFTLDAATWSDKAALLAAFQAAFALPAYFGHNWDALEECLNDLAWAPAAGYAILIDHVAAFRSRSPGRMGDAAGDPDRGHRQLGQDRHAPVRAAAWGAPVCGLPVAVNASYRRREQMSRPRKAAERALGFTIVLEPDETDGGFVVHCPELKGCWSQGDTAEEAIHNISDAITAWLAVQVECTVHVPARDRQA